MCTPLVLDLIQTDLRVLVLSRHVGQNHLIAYLQTIQNLNRIHRAPAQLYGNARSSLAIRIQLEQANGTVRLAENGPADIDHVAQPLDLDGAVHTQIGHGAARQRPVQLAIHSARSVDHVWIYSDYVARNNSVPCIYGRFLAQKDILGLGLGDLQLGLQRRLRDFRDHRTGRHARSNLKRQLLNHAFGAGANGEVVELLLLAFPGGPQLVDLDLLRLQLSVDGVFHDVQLLLLGLKLIRGLFPVGLGEFDVQLGLKLELK